jgi:hypothetical protein
MTQRNAITRPGKRHQQNDAVRATAHPNAGRSQNQTKNPKSPNSHRARGPSQNATRASRPASALKPTISPTQTSPSPRSTAAALSR